MNKILFSLLLLIPLLSFSNDFDSDGLWKSYPIKDSDGNEIKYKNQDFISFDDDLIIWFKFKELISKETGEVSIKTYLDTFKIGQLNNSLYDIYSKEDTLRFKKISNSKIIIYDRGYQIPFKKIQLLKKPSLTLNEVKNYVVGSTLYEIGTDNKIVGNLSKTYQENGKAKYQKVDSRSNWESAYKIVVFNQYVFLKGITSAPTIITSLNNSNLNGLKVDYRFEPKKCILSKVKPINSVETNSNPFQLFIPNTSFEECVSNLSDELLNTELGVASGIKTKKLPVVQVQHTYGCHWSLFHNEDYDGRVNIKVADLINQDSSLCHIVSIPCGYYAERKSANSEWFIYLHEERLETDSSFIIKKAFNWNNTYRVINELKDSQITYYEDYFLDTRNLKKTWTFNDGKEVGFTRTYNIDGILIEEIKH